MHNWNTDEETFKKADSKAYKLWRIIQLVNYGLEGEKLDKNEVKKAWPRIHEQLDPDKKKVLEFYLWGKRWRKEPGLAFDRNNFWQWYFAKNISSKIST